MKSSGSTGSPFPAGSYQTEPERPPSTQYRKNLKASILGAVYGSQARDEIKN